MKKLKYLISYGLTKRIKSKAFIISNIIVGIVILAITLLPNILANVDFGPDAIEGNIVIIDDSGEELDLALIIEESFNNFFESIAGVENSVVFTQSDDASLIETIFDESEYQLLILIETNTDDLLDVTFYQNGINNDAFNIISLIVNDLQRMIYAHQAGVDIGQIGDTITSTQTAQGTSRVEIAQGLSSLLVVPLFMFIMFGIQFIGSDIIEEKSTKAIEIIIASVRPSIHFIGKILSVLSFLVIQLSLYIIIGIIGVLLSSLLAQNGSSALSWGELTQGYELLILQTILITVFYTIFGAILFLVMGAFMASLAINTEDYQQIQTPMIMLVMTGYIASIFAASFQSDVLLVILSYIPFFAPMVVPAAFLGGSLGVIELIISAAILIASIFLVVIFLAPAYRASILNYDQSKLLKRITNTFKQAKALKENRRLYEDTNNHNHQNS